MYDKLARFYDITHAALQDDIPFLLMLAAATDGQILELGCGSGRLLLPLARAGYNVTGVDNSEAMLALARQKLQAEPQTVADKVQLLAQDMITLDMTSLPVTHRFSLVIIPYNTLMHFSRGQMKKILRRVQAVLGENGRLFIDLANPLVLSALPDSLPMAQEYEYHDPETREIIRQYASQQLDSDSQILQVNWRYDVMAANGDIKDQTLATVAYHYLFPHEIELLLRETGLKLLRMHGNYDAEPFFEDSERMLVLAAHIG